MGKTRGGGKLESRSLCRPSRAAKTWQGRKLPNRRSGSIVAVMQSRNEQARAGSILNSDGRKAHDRGHHAKLPTWTCAKRAAGEAAAVSGRQGRVAC